MHEARKLEAGRNGPSGHQLAEEISATHEAEIAWLEKWL